MMNVRYYGEFQDVNGSIWKVNIYSNDFSGTAEEILLGDSPVIINYEADKDVFKPIKYSGITIKVLTDTMLDVYSKSVFDHKIEVLKDNILWWHGWVTPNVYTSEYCFLDELEINGIDDLAALKYVDYFTLNQESTVVFDYSTTLANMSVNSSMTFTSEATIETLLKNNEICISKIILTKLEDSYTINIRLANRISGEIKYFTFYTIVDLYTYPTTSQRYGYFDIEINKGLKTITLHSHVNIFHQVWNGLPSTKTIEDYISPQIQSFKEIIFNILNYKNSNYILYYFNDLDDWNINLLDTLKISEKSFYDEEDKPIKCSEVLENINMFLGTTMCQWRSNFNVLKPELYANGDIYNDLPVVLITEYGNASLSNSMSIYDSEVAENNSTISLNSVYNQITVQSKQIPDSKELVTIPCKIDDIEGTFKTVYEDSGEYIFHTGSVSNYRLKYAPFEQTLGGGSAYVGYARYDVNELYPHPDFEYAFARVHPNLLKSGDFYDWRTYFRWLAKQPRKGFDGCPILFQDTLTTLINPVQKTKWLVISMDVLYVGKEDADEDLQYWFFNPDNDSVIHGTDVENEQVYTIQASLSIGDKYWNGTEWSTDEEATFFIGLDSTEGLKYNTWYSVKDTTDFTKNLSAKGYPIPIKSSDNLSGSLHFEIRQRTPSKIGWVNDEPVEIISLEWEDIVADPSLLPITDRYIVPTVFPCGNRTNNNSTSASIVVTAILAKNFKISLIPEGENQYENNDVIYNQVIDNSNVVEFSDKTMLLNTYNTNFSIMENNNNVLYGNSLCEQLYSEGYYIRPEQHLVQRYIDYYSQPRLIHSNTFKMGNIEPVDGLNVPYIPDKRFMVGSCEYDLKYRKLNTELYEI